jgi:hypothetical protein
MPCVSITDRQLAFAAGDGSDSAAHAPRGYGRLRKRTQIRRPMTSFEMTAEERAMLDELAKTQGLGIGEVLRRSLRLYAAEAAGVSTTSTREVSAPA